MSSLAFLVTELQSLASETRRRHPDVREAAEKSLAILKSSPEQTTIHLASDGPQSEDLLRPVFMGCATKNAKVVAISLGSLQRLIALKAVPQSAVSLIITTMADCMSQGVDIQLRILQTLLSLVTNFPAVHSELLGDALLLCFKLQESRIAVVSSTAAATLRQLVMFVVDKVVDEDRRDDLKPEELSDTTLPNGKTKSLGPSARDAFAVFEDLCLLANSEKPLFLKLEFLRKTFALELIESVLTNYYDLFRKHEELLLLVQHHLCPLVLKALSDRPSFPLTLRSTRVVFLLLKQFSLELGTEAEVFLMLLIKIISADLEGVTPSQSTESFHLGHGARPQWMRVLAMEIMRGLCSDAELMRNVWIRYDAEESGSKVFTSLLTSLKRLVTEKPALLGVSTQIFGVGVSSSTSGETAGGHGLDVAGVAGMVANAASATVSVAVGMMGTGAGLSVQDSAMKLQCIDQLDKADSPPIPEQYIYLLGVQCLVSLCEGFASCIGPLFNTIMVQRPRAAGEPAIRAPRALDLSILPPDEPSTKQLRIVHDMVENGWPPLLAALSFIISTNLSDELFVDVLLSFQAMTNVAGMLGLTTPRDAFFASLAKIAIPARVVSSLDTYIEPPTPRTPAGTLSDNLGLTTPAQAPGLSERNLACLKVYIASSLFLAGSLGDSWFNVLETLQNADYVLTTKGSKVPAASKRNTIGPGQPSSAPGRSVSSGSMQAPNQLASPQSQQSSARHPLLAELDVESLQHSVQRLFDASKNLDDNAFHDFVLALCRLSGIMVGMQSEDDETLALKASTEELPTSPSLTIPDAPHRRRVSGIHLARTLRSGDFGISKLGGVAKLNIHRLIYRDPEIAWDIITSHLLAVIKRTLAPPSIRTQAGRILDDILVVVPRNLSTTGELQPKVQQRVLDVLAQQIIPDISSASNTTTIELRRMGLETLHQILQASGHTLIVGWETIFEMLGSVCKPAVPASSAAEINSAATSPVASRRPPPLGYVNEKTYTSLVKIAFQSLTLVCDSLAELSPENLRLCISTLGQFGRQADTNIALTAAESLLWGVSDSIQTKRKEADKEPEYSALWMFLLLEILGLCTDARPEVRIGATQTLFRTLQLYGATLSADTWDECLWKVTFPLLDSITASMRSAAVTSSSQEPDPGPDPQWDESKILALQSIGSIFQDFLTTKIMHLESFQKGWEVFVGHVQGSWLHDHRIVSATALRCLDKAVKTLVPADEALKEKTLAALETVWRACDIMGNSLVESGTTAEQRAAQNPFTQDSLVAYVDAVRSTRSAFRKVQNEEWQLNRLIRLMVILKGVMTYSQSPDFRPDSDKLSPIQSVVVDAINDIDLSSSGVPSLVLRDLSEYMTLPFIAAFDAPIAADAVSQTSGNAKQSRVPQKRITYIALADMIMLQVVNLYLHLPPQALVDVYNDGTLEAIFSAYTVPIKMRYECPAPSKLSKESPLWKTATRMFLRIVKDCGVQIERLGNQITDTQVGNVWRQIVETFKGYILADCSVAETFSLDAQAEDERFDLIVVEALKIDVLPFVGDSRVPDHVIRQFAIVLQHGSQTREVADYRPPSPASPGVKSPTIPAESDKVETFAHRTVIEGATESGRFFSRERFAYACFDLLFLVCSDDAESYVESRRRTAALALLALLNRCKTTLTSFVADESLRGSLPFSRAREEELLHALRKLSELRLWPGILWAAFSDNPTAYSSQQPDVDSGLKASELIMDLVKRSTKAHLFHFYPVLCEIVAIQRKTPTIWTDVYQGDEPDKDIVKGIVTRNSASSSGWQTVELDARAIAKACLDEIGLEIGLGR